VRETGVCWGVVRSGVGGRDRELVFVVAVIALSVGYLVQLSPFAHQALVTLLHLQVAVIAGRVDVGGG